MPRIKKVYGPNVTVVGKSRRRQPEPDPVSPEMERKLAILGVVIKNGEKHGLDRLDQLGAQQAELERLKEVKASLKERGG